MTVINSVVDLVEARIILPQINLRQIAVLDAVNMYVHMSQYSVMNIWKRRKTKLKSIIIITSVPVKKWNTHAM